MSKYTRALFDLVKGEFIYYKLIIDGKCQFDKFLKDIERDARDKKSFIGIIALMDALGKKCKLPKTKFNHIHISGCNNIFEFKKDRLRVYVFMTKDITIILGGFKNTQKKDIENISRIAKKLDRLNNKRK